MQNCFLSINKSEHNAINLKHSIKCNHFIALFHTILFYSSKWFHNNRYIINISVFILNKLSLVQYDNSVDFQWYCFIGFSQAPPNFLHSNKLVYSVISHVSALASISPFLFVQMVSQMHKICNHIAHKCCIR